MKLAALALGAVLGGLLMVVLHGPIAAVLIPAGLVAGGTLLRGRMQP